MLERIARSLVWLGELAHDIEAARTSGLSLADLRARRREPPPGHEFVSPDTSDPPF